jgi:membrane-bound lytic murein transglycosylase D
MARRFPSLLLLLGCACAGHSGSAPAPVTPASAPAPAGATASSPAPEAAPQAALAPPPTQPDWNAADSSLDQSVAAFLKRAADSLADAEALEALANASPDSAIDAAEAQAEEPPPFGPGVAATWDIDVATYSSHDRVQYYLDFFQTTGRDRMTIWLQRMPHYDWMIRNTMKKYGVPEDMVYLALIESGFSNTAVSRSRAVGMWQFMKGTAKLYGLRVDRWVDQRRDPYRSTDAAARFLAMLQDRFGSIYLAAAAYNAGPGRVGRGLRRLPDDDEGADSLSNDADFFRLYDTRLIRRETKDYVPKLIAAALIAKEPTKYGFPRLAPDDTILPDSIVVPDATGLDVIARLADTSLLAIRDLNPQILVLMTPPGSRTVVRLPPGLGQSVAVAYAALPVKERVTYVEHYVRPGDTMGGIARQYHVSVAMVQSANPRLKPNALRVGQLVVIPTGATPLSPEVRRSIETPVQIASAPAGMHRVRSGETLGSIAVTYNVSVSQLQKWNGLGGSTRISAGQKLRVSPRAASSVAAAPRKSSAPPTKTPGARGTTHVVQPGETLTGLAQRYGVTVAALRQANNLPPQGVLKAGTMLRIPG